MKIIAKSGTRTYLLQASSDEIDLLAGRKICRGDYGDERCEEYILGVTFDITKAFSQIHRNDRRKQEIETVRKTLEGVINSLDIIEPYIEEPKPQEEPNGNNG
jgi:hypothetical protein